MDRHKSSIGRRYDWIPDLPDHRDLVAEVKRRLPLPGKVDLSPKCSPVEDQGDLGSCTANALAGALEFLEDVDGIPFKDVIIDSQMRQVRACLAACGTNPDADMNPLDNPLGFTLGSQNHTRWPNDWTEEMLSFFRGHPLPR